MPDRFYCPDLSGGVIAGPEAHHLRNVLRAMEGDRIELFDGKGRSVNAIVRKVGRRDVQVEIGDVIRDEDALTSVTLAVALPKGDRARFLVEKLTEIGVQSLIPLVTERGVVSPHANKQGKLHAAVIAACKQSGRNQLMEICAPASVSEVARRHSVIVADPSGSSDAAIESAATILIGPEGGWSPAERELFADRNLPAVSLGRYVLRVETAAIVAATKAQ